MNKKFEILSHTADIKIKAYGATHAELFANALHGMFESVSPIIKQDTQTTTRSINLHAADFESLLVDFLADCLYLSDVHNEAYFDVLFEVLNGTHLSAVVYGTPLLGFEGVEIKAVTYHDLHLEQHNGIWQATIVFDI